MSKSEPIKYKTIALSIIALMTLHSLVAHIWNRESPISVSQWGQNTIRSQQYLFAKVDNYCVLVGSSMGAKLGTRLSGQITQKVGLMNLSYAGGGPTTGLKLIELSGKMPACVIVETNVVHREVDEKQLATIKSKLRYFILKHFKAFRHENQPLNMLMTLIRTAREKLRPASKPNTERQLTQRTDSQFQSVLPHIQTRINMIEKIPDKPLIDGIKRLTELAAILEARGIPVFFVEMPGEAMVRKSSHYQRLRRFFENQFATTDFVNPDSAKHHILEIEIAETSDGVHLTQQSASLATAALLKLIDEHI